MMIEGLLLTFYYSALLRHPAPSLEEKITAHIDDVVYCIEQMEKGQKGRKLIKRLNKDLKWLKDHPHE